MTVVIGIDGGGTKTKALMADSNGEIYGSVIAGPSNPNAVDPKELEHTIRFIFSQLESQNEQAFNQVKFCFAGMAGVGEGNTRNALHVVIEKVCKEYHMPYHLHNDGVNALYAGTFGEPGIVLISGTGSISYGLSQDNKFKRVGGWGYLFDDLGSGYDLGKQALMAVFQSFDGREEATVLTDMIKRHFNVNDVPSIIPAVYQDPKPRSVIAPLSRLVMDAYDQGDSVAITIVENAAHDLTHIIKAMQHRLFHASTDHDVILSGGIFTRQDVFVPLMKQQFNEGVNFKRLEHEPVVGAVVAALKEMGVEINDVFKKNMI
ncbi:N-acetylglucosamine kinase [Bacillaceae bacterium W0354]